MSVMNSWNYLFDAMYKQLSEGTVKRYGVDIVHTIVINDFFKRIYVHCKE